MSHNGANHNNGWHLQYSCCNEDAQSELAALNLRGRIAVAIAAAGGRAFSLLLGDPRKVTAVDINPVQIHLCWLKYHAIRLLDRTEYLRFIGIAPNGDRASTYRALSEYLPEDTRAYWDARIDLIGSGLIGAGRYERSIAVLSAIFRVTRGGTIARLRTCADLAEQARLVSSRLWNPGWRLLFGLLFNPMMGRFVIRDKSFYGRPRRRAGVYLVDRLNTCLENNLARDSFILEMYTAGVLGEDGPLPLHLLEGNYETVRKRLDRLSFVCEDIAQHLECREPGSVEAFSLSDLGSYVLESGYVREDLPWDDLTRALRHIYRDGEYAPYVHMANEVLTDESITEGQWVSYFEEYFSTDYFGANLQKYFRPRWFHWFSDSTQAKLQNASVHAFRGAAFGIVESHADDLTGALAHDQKLGESCAWLHLWIERLFEQAQYISDSTWAQEDAEYLSHFRDYPQYFHASQTFDPLIEPWIAVIRAQAWLVTRNTRPFDEGRKQQLADAWGLSGWRRRIFLDTNILILDNNQFIDSLYQLIYDFLMSLPHGAHDLQAITCNECLKPRPWFWLLAPARVNIWNGDPHAFNLEHPPNPFPSDVAPSYTCNMSGVVVHEVMHVVDGFNRTNSPQATWYDPRRAELLSAAGCPHMNYLRSNCGRCDDCFFVEFPQEFVASIGNDYFIDTEHTLDLGLLRFANGYLDPINQWLLVAELFGRIMNDGTTRFWRIDTAVAVQTSDRRVRWQGDRISRVTLEEGHSGSGWRFEFDADDMVEAAYPLVAPWLTSGPSAVPGEIFEGEMCSLQASADDGDDPTEALSYLWAPEVGTIQGEGSVVSFTAPVVCEAGNIGIELSVVDPDGLVSAAETGFVHVTPYPRLGDLDGDGGVDLRDLADLQVCFTGDGGTVLPECSNADVDRDDDVDLQDFAAMGWTGPCWQPM